LKAKVEIRVSIENDEQQEVWEDLHKLEVDEHNPELLLNNTITVAKKAITLMMVPAVDAGVFGD